jgi:Flp pilus assembly protein TadG
MTRAQFAICADESGNSMIEMALVMPLLATLLVGTVDISRACAAKLGLEQAAQRTIELVQRTDYNTDDTDIYEGDAEEAAGEGSTATVTDWLECNNDGVHLDYDTGVCANAADPYSRYVQIEVQQPFTPMFGTMFFPNPNSDGSVTMRATAGVRTQ